MIRLQTIYLCLLLSPVIAALTSLLVESPMGCALRKRLAGEERADPTHVSVYLPPAHPWLSEGLQCVGCTGLWVALAACLLALPRPWQPLETAIGVACSWFVARLLLGLARLVEHHGGE